MQVFPTEDAEVVGIGEHEPDGPIELTVERIACPRHAEPFRGAWPTGFSAFGLALTQEVLNDETFVELVGGEMAKLHELLDTRPLCERVSRSTLQRIYIESGIGKEARCALCHELAIGTSYTTRIGTETRPRKIRHACFRCVVFSMTPMN